MRIPRRAREYERTCANCGNIWYAPRWAVHPPKQGLPIKGSKYAVNAVVAANAELAEEAAAFRVCSKCGSVHYSQRPVRS